MGDGNQNAGAQDAVSNPWLAPMNGRSAADVLVRAFAGAEGVEFAFIFGSLAAGTERPESDMDLMVIGSIEGIEISKRVSRLMDSHFGREANWVNYTRQEYLERIRNRNHFLLNVLEGPKIFVVGSEQDLSAAATDTTPKP